MHNRFSIVELKKNDNDFLVAYGIGHLIDGALIALVFSEYGRWLRW
jgi:hypothetical protein